jgi:hypothetical protein
MAAEVIQVASDDVIVVENTTVEVIEIDGDDVLVVRETTVEVSEVGIQGPAGAQGTPGQAGVSYLTYAADGSISGHKVVKITTAGKIGYASSSEPGDAATVLGITMNAAADGDDVNVQNSGEMTEPTWNWIVGTPVFAGVDGALTQAPPTEGFQLVVGTATTATRIVISIKSAIILI